MKSSQNDRIILESIFLQFPQANSGRIYPADAFEEHIKKLEIQIRNEKIKNRKKIIKELLK